MVKESNVETAVEFCERVYPEMMVEFKRIQAEDYEVFCKKQRDYGPGNIALGTTLATKEDTLMSLTGLIIRMNDKIQRLLNLLVKNGDAKPENNVRTSTITLPSKEDGEDD